LVPKKDVSNHVVAREGVTLAASSKLSRAGRILCALDDERVLTAGLSAEIVCRGVATPTRFALVEGACDSGGCVFGLGPHLLCWYDSTLHEVGRLGEIPRESLLAIGPDSTLLAASPRGILHVFQ
jgi:hypothetical protein